MWNCTSSSAKSVYVRCPHIFSWPIYARLIAAIYDWRPNLFMQALIADFEVSEGIYSRARIEDADSVCLWLGANVMLEYSCEEVIFTCISHEKRVLFEIIHFYSAGRRSSEKELRKCKSQFRSPCRRFAVPERPSNHHSGTLDSKILVISNLFITS